MRQVVIFDLDGTLADISHRRHLVEGEKKNWDAFFKACVDDQPNKAVIETARALYRAGYQIVILSGRSESVRKETTAWLAQAGVFYSYILMRPEKDYTPDEVLKKSWLMEIDGEILCVFDDRQKVVDMWRAMGLVCFQVAEGKF